MENGFGRNQCEEGAFVNVNTNQVLMEEQKDKTVYYLPCYVRLKVKTVKEFQIEKLSGVISATLLFGYYHGNLPEDILSQFTGEGTKAVILQLPRQPCIELRQNNQITLKQQVNSKIMDYVIRTQFDCNLDGDIFLTPFEIFNLHLTVTVQTIVLDPKLNNGRNVHIKFNCMDTTMVQTIDSGSDCEYGTYTLASYFLDCDYTNSANHRFLPVSVLEPEKRIGDNSKKEKKKKKEKQRKQETESMFKTVEDHQSNIKMNASPKSSIDSIRAPKNKSKLNAKQRSASSSEKEKKVKNYQYTHFRVPLYKHPVSSLVEIFVPIWILAAINLGIYYQDSNVLADKIASIATITLAFVAFLPTINEKIPQTSIIKLIQIIIYIQIGTTFLTLLDSLTVRKYDPTLYETVWNSNGYFIVTMLINIICFVIVAVLLVFHKLWWEKIYLREKEDKKIGKIVRDHWESKDCDEEFKQAIISNKIIVLAPDFAKIKVSSQKMEKF